MPATREHDSRSRRSPLIERSKALGAILREEFGVPFRFHDAETGGPLGGPDPSAAPLGRDEVVRLGPEGRAEVEDLEDGRLRLIFPFGDADGPLGVAVGVIPALARTGPDAVEERARLRKWLRSVHDRLGLADRSSAMRRREAAREGQASLAWDAILGFEHLLGALRIQAPPEKSARRILRVAADLLKARSVVWVPHDPDAEVVIEGDPGLSPWDCGRLASLAAQHPDREKPGFLICNEVRPEGWAARFPRVANLLAVPVLDRGKSGWIIALNKGEGPAASPAGRDAARDRLGEQGRTPRPRVASSPGSAPFRRIDAAILTSFATLLAMHLRASGRYENLKHVMVGLTRSLTAAIDAKDSYTSGHSERVARVAVELGRELGLDGEELSDIYLAGLLHDIGKIGVRDAVLCKPGPLTEEEFDHVKQHVTIGYRILADLRPIRNLLPGVLYHHERYDGAGYPEGLKGDMIPFLARILAVADSYDAMSASRPYRAALAADRVEDALTRGAGSQWDALVVDAFFRCRSKINLIRQRGVGESLRHALDGALRNADPNNTRTIELRMR